MLLLNIRFQHPNLIDQLMTVQSDMEHAKDAKPDRCKSMLSITMYKEVRRSLAPVFQSEDF